MLDQYRDFKRDFFPRLLLFFVWGMISRVLLCDVYGDDGGDDGDGVHFRVFLNVNYN